MTRKRSTSCIQVAAIFISTILQLAIIVGTSCMMSFPFYASYWKGDVTTGSNSITYDWDLSTFIGLYKMTTQYSVGICTNQVFNYPTLDWANESGNFPLLNIARVTAGVALAFQILSFLVKCCPLLIKTK